MKMLRIAMFLILPLLSGCLLYEKQEVDISLTETGGDFWVRHTGWKSSDDDAEKITKDFDELIKKYGPDEKGLEEELSNEGIYLLEKKIYLQDGKINTEYHGLAPYGSPAFQAKFRLMNDEILYVVDAPEKWKVESNGRVYSTEKNSVITWPKDEKSLTWTVMDNSKDKKKDNLIKLFAEWQDKMNKKEKKE